MHRVGLVSIPVFKFGRFQNRGPYIDPIYYDTCYKDFQKRALKMIMYYAMLYYTILHTILYTIYIQYIV